MKKINKKGFTLVELMAVLIILIIIVVIAINRVNETSEKAKNNAIISNAGIYIKAVNDALDLNSLSTVTSFEGSFPIQVFDSLDVRISGKKPDGGYLTLTDDEVTGGCLEYEGSYVNYRKGKVKKPRKGTCSFTLEYAYDFTGSVQEFTVPFTAIYKVELWGAHGGNNGATQGKGAYTSGEIVLNAGEKLYIYVGSAGNATRPSVSEYKAGGYNGGGYTNGQSCCDRTYGTGGGATDVRLVGGEWNDAESLASRIMVAGGGGGGFNGGSGGAAGGLNGQNGLSNNGYGPGPGATQTSGGINTVQAAASGSFGKGGEGGNSGLSTGGGGGYYGGAGSHHIDAAGGGSSYISGHTGCVAIISKENITPKDGCDNGTTDYSCSVHYSGKVFTDTVMKSGNDSMPTFDGKSTMVGSNLNGYAKITFVELVNDNVKKYNYTGTEQTFIAQKTGTYKLEVWGAQGGNGNETYIGGYGAYSVGYVNLNKNDKLYINVGGVGQSSCVSTDCNGGYNGGGKGQPYTGDSYNYVSGGGGGTSIAAKSGLLVDLTDNDLFIVAGGGAGSYYHSSGGAGYSNNGANGGGYVGVSGKTCSYTSSYATGGTQSTGGAAGYRGGAGSRGQGGTYAGGSSGGGGGYYGGGSAAHAGAGGGSGYIANPLLTNKKMYCYNCSESDDESTKTISTTCVSETSTSKCAKKGNGFAIITLVE